MTNPRADGDYSPAESRRRSDSLADGRSAPGAKRKSLHVLEGLLILQTDLVDQLGVDNNALL
jgi:hypothetical protein